MSHDGARTVHDLLDVKVGGVRVADTDSTTLSRANPDVRPDWLLADVSRERMDVLSPFDEMKLLSGREFLVQKVLEWAE